MLVGVVPELAVADDFPPKPIITLFKGELKDVIIIFENGVQTLLLKPRFQLLKEVSLLNLHSVMLVLLVVKVLDEGVHRRNQISIGGGLVQLHQPKVEGLLLLSEVVGCAEARN